MSNTSKPATFEANLSRFKAATANSMKYARLCADMALQHFADHGDVAKLQAFIDAMPKNYLRRAAFLKWAADHSPLTMEANKLVKDKGENATAWNVDAALKVAFWDYLPDTEQMFFGEDDVVTSLNKAIKRLKSDKYTPSDKKAADKLAAAEKAIAALA